LHRRLEGDEDEDIHPYILINSFVLYDHTIFIPFIPLTLNCIIIYNILANIKNFSIEVTEQFSIRVTVTEQFYKMIIRLHLIQINKTELS